jgi:PAS domain-containing protein
MPQFSSSLPDSIRRWTWRLEQLRARARRITRRSGAEPIPSDVILAEALELCNSVLLDLAGAELKMKQYRDTLHGERQEAASLFERTPMASVSTDGSGIIGVANPRAAALLNVSARHLVGKPLLHFSQDRTAFLALVRSLPSGGETSNGTLSIRPRERRTISVDVVIIPRTIADPTEWLWFLTTPPATSRIVEEDRLDVPQDADSDVPAFATEAEHRAS